MDHLYTKNGNPLQVSGDTVYSRSGAVVGRINGDRVFGPCECSGLSDLG
jgi:hypothetical protein